MWAAPEIQEVLATYLGRRLQDLKSSEQALPAYRLPDLFRAASSAYSGPKVRIVDSEHYQSLSMLLGPKQHPGDPRKVNQCRRLAWAISADADEFFPVERFWISAADRSDPKAGVIVRLKYDQMRDKAVLEVAAQDAARCDELVGRLLAWSVQHSIYRNKAIRLAYSAGVKDAYGDPEKPEQVRLAFHDAGEISEEAFVVDDDTKKMLLRNVVDLHEKRSSLSQLGVPSRRGVLLYGPPGTGKTFACRYISGKLPEATRLFVTGGALAQVAALFSVARLYSPTCVFLEDADLVFAARDINYNNAILADGLRRNDDITIVITTNSLERIERAIKDRPGRISQCIYFGPPNAELRRRYLEEFLRPYDIADLDVGALVREGDGATQAFLKEWTLRAAQISLERQGDVGKARRLSNGDFRSALAEMTRFANRFSDAVIGFRPNES